MESQALSNPVEDSSYYEIKNPDELTLSAT